MLTDILDICNGFYYNCYMTQFVYAKLQENERVLLKSTGSLGLFPTFMELPRIGITFHWFTEFLEKSVTLKDEYTEVHKTDGRMYRASRDNSGNVILSDTRDGGFVSDITFSAAEITGVLSHCKNITL